MRIFVVRNTSALASEAASLTQRLPGAHAKFAELSRRTRSPAQGSLGLGVSCRHCRHKLSTSLDR